MYLASAINELLGLFSGGNYRNTADSGRLNIFFPRRIDPSLAQIDQTLNNVQLYASCNLILYIADQYLNCGVEVADNLRELTLQKLIYSIAWAQVMIPWLQETMCTWCDQC